MRKVIALFVGCVLFCSPPAQAATCVEGLIMLDKTLSKMELTDDEFNIATDLMFKAKVEADRGNMQKCIYIVSDIIRVVLLKTVN